MTDREFVYQELTEQPINSGNFKFVFDRPEDGYLLCGFAIFNGNLNIYGSDYIVIESASKLMIRIKTKSYNKIFKINSTKLDRPLEVNLISEYLEIQFEDFMNIISKEQWTVEDI